MPGKIKNPKTGRMVNKNGKIGLQIIKNKLRNKIFKGGMRQHGGFIENENEEEENEENYENDDNLVTITESDYFEVPYNTNISWVPDHIGVDPNGNNQDALQELYELFQDEVPNDLHPNTVDMLFFDICTKVLEFPHNNVVQFLLTN